MSNSDGGAVVESTPLKEKKGKGKVEERGG